jgi:hypothetical protein
MPTMMVSMRDLLQPVTKAHVKGAHYKKRDDGDDKD